MVACSKSVNYTDGGIGKGKGFPHILVSVGGGAAGAVGVRGPMYLGKNYEMRSPFLSICFLILM